jgi:hypothetical protein
MRYIGLLFVALTVPAISADLRGTELGSSCEAITGREMALGSARPLLHQETNTSALRFEGRELARDVSIVYICKNGIFEIGSYRLSRAPFDAAAEFFGAAYDAINRKLGPAYDEFASGVPEPQHHGFPKAGMNEPHSYIVLWKGPGYRADVSLAPDPLPPDPNTSWRVLVKISRDQ